MSYIGNQVTSIPFITDTFSGTGAQTAFTPLTRAPAGSASIAVFIAGVYQPPSAYTLNGVTLTFNSAPTAGTGNIVVLHLGNGSAVQVPSDGSVTLTKLSNDTYSYINSAFTVANTGGAAASYANSAFTTANSGFAVANSAGSYANSAFASANTSVASGSYANSAFNTANSAGTYANSAFTKANNATSNGSFAVTGSGLAVSLTGSVITGYKILGQIATTANAITNVYVVPAATSASIGTITVCNGTPSDVLLDLVMRPSTEALATKHYIIRGITLPAADTLIIDSGVTLNTGAILAANTTGGNAAACAAGISVHAYGVEIV
jgi:hypothetical protein